MKKDKSGGLAKPDSDDDYLKRLGDCEDQAIDQFDKTVLTLSGGAFAVSFAFLKDVVKPEVVSHKGFLIGAWAFWSLSLLSTLTSFYCSHLAMRHAQRQFRQGIREEKKLIGRYGDAVTWFNPISGLSFLAGLISMCFFVTTNLGNEQYTQSDRTHTTNSSTTNAPRKTTPSPNSATTEPATTAPASPQSK